MQVQGCMLYVGYTLQPHFNSCDTLMFQEYTIITSYLAESVTTYEYMLIMLLGYALCMYECNFLPCTPYGLMY